MDKTIGFPLMASLLGGHALAPRLIVNADDFGISERVNAGIAQAHREGIVTATSLMAVGPAFESAIGWCRALPSLDVGVHLTLVGARPLAAQESSLVDRNGRFYPNYQSLLKRYFRGTILRADIQAEWSAQIERVIGSGIPVSHIDSHQHVHALPGIAGLTFRLARRYGIPFVRVPIENIRWRFPEDWHALRRIFESAGLRISWIAARMAGWGGEGRAAPRFMGFQEGGRLDRFRLLRLVSSLKPGKVYEIMCHPGLDPPAPGLHRWGYDHAGELAALTDPGVRSAIDRLGIALSNFRKLTG